MTHIISEIINRLCQLSESKFSLSVLACISFEKPSLDYVIISHRCSDRMPSGYVDAGGLAGYSVRLQRLAFWGFGSESR
jgi:hypothetical protein